MLTALPCEGVGGNRHAELRFPWSLDSRDDEVMRCEPPVSQVEFPTCTRPPISDTVQGLHLSLGVREIDRLDVG
jgi:hypothetical protein